MSTARSVFTEAIEDHLALKKQNVALETAMPLARYDVGDPLDRYPGGPNRAEGTVIVAEEQLAGVEAPAAELDEPVTSQATQLIVGPSPEQAMEAATALDPSFADRPFEPLTGMAPMLSLVEDIEDEDDGVDAVATDAPSGDVLRFPGGVGPREDSVDQPVDAEPAPEPEGQLQVETHAFTVDEVVTSTSEQHAAASPAATAVAAPAAEHDAPTGEQPVLVIDTDEPLATSDFSDPIEPARSSRRKPRFFGLGRKRSKDDGAGEGWFTDGPRDFNWD